MRSASRQRFKLPRNRNQRFPITLETLEDRTLLSGVHPLYQLVSTPSGVAPLASASPIGFSPAQISQAYGFNQIKFNGVTGDGSGQTIAIVDAYDDPNIQTDLDAFSTQYGLPTTASKQFTFTKENESGGSSMPAASTSWAIEESLDVEWAHAIAPKANILLIEASTNLDSDIYTAIGFAASQPGVSVVSMSFGESESSGETGLDSQFFVTPANHANVAFVASAGDSGAPPEYPSASPNVLAIGGTTLQIDSAGDYLGESAWSGGGGGISAYEAQPSYQQGIVTQTSTNRADPDVAYDANPGSGFAIYDSYTYGTSTPWMKIGGTSCGAPQWSALVAIADQGRSIAGEAPLDGPTQLLPMIYSLPSSDFHDITTGHSNGNPNEYAGPGYDLVTGLGTPLANLVVSGLVGSTSVAPSTTTLTSSANPSVFGQSVTFTAQVTGGGATPTGSVTFMDGTATLATVSLTNGAASYSTSALPITTSAITAVYSGSASYSGSTSNAVMQTVTKGSTTDVLTVQPSPVVVGQTVTLTATVSALPPAGGMPNGTVTFRDGTTTIGSARLNGSGVAVFQTSALAVGTHNLTAVWGGNSTFIGSTSNGVMEVVSSNPQTPSSTTLSSTLSSSVYGQSVTFTAQVTGAGGTPTGTVTFLNGTAPLGNMSLINGTATLTITTLAPATYNISASYSGDATFIGSTSNTLPLTVSQSSDTVALSSLTNPSVVGQSVSLTATVTATAPGAGTPTGSIVFYNGTTQIGSGTLGGGTITVSTSTLPVGNDSITAAYSGDADFSSQTSSVLTQVVNPPTSGTTVTALTSSVNPSLFGQSVTFTAQVTGSAGAPTGSVAFMNGAATLATMSLTSGAASYSTSALPIATSAITAVYSGSASYSGSTSNAVMQTVTKGSTTDVLTVMPSPVTVGQTVTLTATVSAVPPAGGTPNGTVTFRDGTTTIGTARLNGSGVAVFQTSALAVGTHNLTAVWSGNSNFVGSTSSSVPLTVNPSSTVIASNSNQGPLSDSLVAAALERKSHALVAETAGGGPFADASPMLVKELSLSNAGVVGQARAANALETAVWARIPASAAGFGIGDALQGEWIVDLLLATRQV
jgi:subtilase family serine protease